MRKVMCSWLTAGETATKGETCADQMKNSFQAHKGDTAIRVTLAKRVGCVPCL